MISSESHPGTSILELGPFLGLSLLAEDVGELRLGDLLERVGLVHVDRERVVGDECSIGSLLLGGLDLLRLVGLDLAARVGDVDRAVLERGDADARSAAAHGDRHARASRSRYSSAQRLGEIDHRVRALVLEHRLPGLRGVGRRCGRRRGARRCGSSGSAVGRKRREQSAGSRSTPGVWGRGGGVVTEQCVQQIAELGVDLGVGACVGALDLRRRSPGRSTDPGSSQVSATVL